MIKESESSVNIKKVLYIFLIFLKSVFRKYFVHFRDGALARCLTLRVIQSPDTQVSACAIISEN